MREPRTCASCGRTITWRRKWDRDWDAVRWCSVACRRRGAPDPALLDRLRALAPVDLDDAAARLGEEREAVRSAARLLVAEGRGQLVQRGRVVDPSTARGPVTLR
ncbi:MAG TPA: DUF2256 domain-containing protein [Mycobacteriales bacterium]|nr:DUF2256 domain-containing protein [Mycobacteriales bacterium]